MLRAARELQGWSVDEVAVELNLLPRVVEALERDDYSNIAGWTYAVGYLRNYARLAGVSIEKAISERQDLLPPREDGPGTMTEALQNRKQPIPIHYRWVVTAAVLIIVVGGLYAAYLNRSTDVERARVDLVEQSRSQLPEASTPPMSASEVNPTPATNAAPSTLAVTLEGATEVAGTSPNPVPVTSPLPVSGVAPGSVESGPESAAATRPEEQGQVASSESAESGGQSAIQTDSTVARTITTVALSDSSTQSGSSEKKEPKPSEAPSSKKEQSKTQVAVVQKTESNQKKSSTPDASSSAQSSPAATSPALSPDPNPQFATAFSSSSTAMPSGTTRPVSADTRELMIKVRESTHLVVWDRDNEVLLRRYVESGKVVSLAGRPPFTLTVSYPEGATIIYNGREMAIPVPKNGLNAKFRVGP